MKKRTSRERREQPQVERVEVLEVVTREPDRAVAVALETQIIDLQEQVKEDGARFTTLQEMVNANQVQISALGETLKACQAQISDLQNQTTRINTYLDNTQKPPLAPLPTPPVIDLVPLPTRDKNGVHISIIGRGFVPSLDPTNPQSVSIVVTRSDGSMQQYRKYTSPAGR